MATTKTQAPTSTEELAREIEELRKEVDRLRASMATGTMQQTLEQIKAAADEVRKGTTEDLSTLRREIRAHPLPSVLIAFGVGTLVGVLISR